MAKVPKKTRQEILAEEIELIMKQNHLQMVHHIRISHNSGWRKWVGKMAIKVLARCNPAVGIELVPMQKEQ